MLNYMRRHASSTTIKILFWIIIAVFILWGVGTFTSSESIYAAQVNGDTIGPKEVRRTAQQLERMYRQLYGDNLTPELVKSLDFANQALDRRINVALLKQEAARLGFTVTDEEVRESIQGMQGLTVDGRFERETYFRFLRMQGMSPTDFEAEQRDQLLVQKVQELVASSIRPDEAGARELFRFQDEKVDLSFVRVKASTLAKDITPTDAEVAKQYEDHRDMYREPERVAIEYVSYDPKHFEKAIEIADADVEKEYETYKADRYSDPEEIHARHILLAVPRGADAKKRDEVRAKATAILERVKKGEDFASVAKESSEDKGTRDKGGDLGFIRRGHAEEPFEEAAFALQPGELSPVVETRRGFHVIKVEERKAAREKPLAEVRDEIVKNLRLERAQEAAREAAFSDAEKANGGSALAELAKARGLDVESPPPFGEHEEIVGLSRQPDLSKSAFATPARQVGPVAQVGDVLVLFRVREKIPSRIPPLEEIRDKVLAEIRDEQATAKAREHAEALRKIAAEKKSLEEIAAAERISIEETGPFTRLGDYVPRIGSAPELKHDAFALTKDAPVASQAYVVGGDAYVAMLKEHAPADLAEFDKKKDELVKRHLEDERQAAMDALLNQLKRRANIQVNRSVLTS